MAFGITAAGIAAAAAAELPRIFDDAQDVLREGEPQYLRDGNPTSIPGKIAQAAGRSACRIYGTGSVDLNAASQEKYERACRPYLDDTNPPGGDGVGIAQQFPGGQCEGVIYDIFYSQAVRTSDAFGCTAFGDPVDNGGFPSAAAFGPVSGFSEVLTSITPIFGQDSEQRYRYTANGVERFLTMGGADVRRFWAACGPSYRLSAFDVVRRDGNADDCGSIPPDVIQPRPIADPNPPPFRFNPDPFIDVDVNVTVNNDGSITVNVGTGPITVDPFGGGGGGDGGGGGNDPVGGPGVSGGSGDTGVGGTDEGSAGDGEELVGVLVQVLAAPLDANRFFNNSELVYRGAYYVTMGYPGRLGLDMSGGTAEVLQFFHAQQRGLTDYRVRANVGFNLRVTPYYRTIEP